MKAKLEFDLSDEDDRMEHMRCMKSTDMAIALWDLQVGNFRKTILRELESIATQHLTMEDGAYYVLDKITQHLSDHNIDVQDLIK